MPHIFRFHKGRNNNIYDWKASDRIMAADVREVMDKTNVLTSAAGTSIPTPIARMFLFKTAFEIMAAQIRDNSFDKDSIYAGLVSEVLDFLELLYKAGDDERKFRYQKWTFESTQDAEQENFFFGTSHGHRLLNESFKQAVAQEPFKNKLEITLIYYKENNVELLVGGTSPFSFVFTSPNFTRKFKERNFSRIPGLVSGYNLFAKEYKQLHERDEAFVKYVEDLLGTPGLPESFQGFKEYVENTRVRYYDKFNAKLQALKDIQIDDVPLVVAGVALKQLHEEEYQEQVNRYSDLKIDLPEGSFYTGKLTPLFLLDRMEFDGNYTSKENKWQSKTRVDQQLYPEKTLEDIMKRPLPGVDGVKYPFLSIFDFFEPFLVKLPGYILNSDRYLTIVDNQDFALPIKPIFFHFFPISTLKNYIEVNIKGDILIFSLKIPVCSSSQNANGEKKYLFSKKIYEKNKNVIQYSGNIGIFPFTKAAESDLLYTNKYTIASYERKDTNEKLGDIKLYKRTGVDPINLSPISRGEYQSETMRSSYCLATESFSIVQLNFKHLAMAVGCTFIPKFTEIINGNKEYIYAIDFGTSNSHVEYGQVIKDEITRTQAFAIDESKMQMVMLHKPTEVVLDDGGSRYNDYEREIGDDIYNHTRKLVLREFVPFQIGGQKGTTVNFPFRTAICEGKTFIANGDKNQLFAHANIGFLIDEDIATTSEVTYTTDLKWELERSVGDVWYQKRVSLFFRHLLLLIRTKAMLEDDDKRADLRRLKIALSFPISMGATLKTKLLELFEVQKKEILMNNIQSVADVSESIAPYYQRRSDNINIQNDCFCNIDIGGGSTDIALVNKDIDNVNMLKCYCASFKFAGNKLWGSGANEFAYEQNGFISYYKKHIANNDPSLYDAVEKLFSRDNIRSEDIVDFLFSSPANRFEEIFGKHKELRAVLCIHYAAILFYITRLAKLQKVAKLRFVSFSGKGSEYLKLMSPDKTFLSGLTERLLCHFTDADFLRPDFALAQQDIDPKVITAKGAVHAANDSMKVADNSWGQKDYTGSNKKILSLINENYKGFYDIELEKDMITYSDLREGSKYYDSVMRNLYEFFHLLFDNVELCGLINRNLEVNDFAHYKHFFIPKVANNTEEEILGQIKKEGVLRDSFAAVLSKFPQSADTVVSAPFFYALDYSLVGLSKQIADNG